MGWGSFGKAKKKLIKGGGLSGENLNSKLAAIKNFYGGKFPVRPPRNTKPKDEDEFEDIEIIE